MLSAGRWDIEPIVLQSLVDFVDPRLTLLPEADMEVDRVFDLALPTHLHARERKEHAVVIRQEGDVVVASHVSHPEILLKELVGFGHAGHCEVEVVEFHPRRPPQGATTKSA